nr:eglin C [Whitmania pigra]
MKLLVFLSIMVVVASSHFDLEFERFPNVVGKAVEVAREYFKVHRPQLEVHFLPEGSFVTADLRYNRLRVFYDTNTNLVVDVPVVG